MGGNGLCVKFDFSMREIFARDCIDLLVDPVNLALEDGYSAEDKLLVLCAVGIARFVNVEQVHALDLGRAQKNSQAGVNPTSHEERSPT
jgi:hypothetical protein